jgi:leucyl-tRNA synthetase
MWATLGHNDLVVETPWPTYDEHWLVEDSVTIAVQVNGKLRATIEVAKDAEQVPVEEAAFAEAAVIDAIDGKEIRKIIYVPNRILNVVV